MELEEECGLYCPGSFTKPEFRPPEGFNIPTYVAGTLKVRPSLPRSMHGSRSLRPPKIQHTHRPVEMPTCRDNFAIAKKFHTENLEHQPLPDRVDDRVFTNLNFGRAKSCGSLPSCKSYRKYQEITPKVFQRRPRNQALNQLYGPVLGCKVPQTRMDLAICWDAPVDPTYEPRRPVHIDGSDGGPAPGIFTLVQHPVGPSGSEIYSPDGFYRPRAASADPMKFERLVKAPNRHSEELCKRAYPRISSPSEARESISRHSPSEDDSVARNRMKLLTRYKTEAEEEIEAANSRDLLAPKESKCHLCKGFGDIRISEAEHDLAKRYTSSPELAPRRDKRKHATYLRNCTACEHRSKEEEKEARKHNQRLALHSAAPRLGPDDPRRNGLPNTLNVPRPKTPFAKRSFCIDTLTPPFSVVKGCRDADYPEHWRLTSVYQQSYRPPRNHRPSLLSRTKR